VSARALRPSLRANPAAHLPSPWELLARAPAALVARVWEEIQADEVLDRAAALSYYLLFAAFPALLFLAALLGLLPAPGLMERLVGYLDRVLPPDAASLLRRTLAELPRGATRSLLSVGALTALWSASAGMTSLIAALNVVRDVEDPRPWWLRRLLAVALTLGVMLFLVTALVLLVLGPPLAQALASPAGLGPVVTVAWRLLEWPVAAGLALAGIALTYGLAPARRPAWRGITPGALFALLAWLGASAALRAYVQHLADYHATYGSIGAVILLLLWLYLSGLALLVGAEIDAELERAVAAPARDGTAESGERAA